MMRSAVALVKVAASSQQTLTAVTEALPLQPQLFCQTPWAHVQRLSSNIAAGSTSKAASSSPVTIASPAAASQVKSSRADAAPSSAQLGFVASREAALASVPTLPKFLGFAGAIPFLALSPYSVEALQMGSWVDKAAHAQVVYGAIICTFLGAVHWGSAMSTMSVAKSGKAAAAMNERYMWSIVPSLAAWPIVFMELGPGSLAAALLLGICYLSDRSYARLGSLPPWYMTLRGWLTLLAVMGCLSTTAYYLGKDIKRAEEKIKEEDEREAAAAAEAQAKAAALLVEQAAPVVERAVPKRKKGWLW